MMKRKVYSFSANEDEQLYIDRAIDNYKSTISEAYRDQFSDSQILKMIIKKVVQSDAERGKEVLGLLKSDQKKGR